MTDREALEAIGKRIKQAWEDRPNNVLGLATVLAAVVDDIEITLASIGLDPKEGRKYDR